MMQDYIRATEELWQIRDSLNARNDVYLNAKNIIDEIIFLLGEGKIVVCEKNKDQWYVNEWVKKAILLNFKVSEMKLYDGNCMKWYDKVDPQFLNFSQDSFEKKGCRIVPGAFIRQGEDIEDLKSFLKEHNNRFPITIIGAGSNLIIRDKGIEGVVEREFLWKY